MESHNEREAQIAATRTTSTATIPVGFKLLELASFFRMRVRDFFNPNFIEGVFADVAEYQAILKQYSGRSLDRAKAVEIGFGARPLRLFALSGMGADVVGADI